MEEKGEFFSARHKQLLNIATWAKYLAWVSLIIIIANSGIGTMLRFVTLYRQVQGFISPSQNIFEAMALLQGDRLFWVDMILDFALGILRAIIYYMVLKGISLGLSMIVETDINYREKKSAEELK